MPVFGNKQLPKASDDMDFRGKLTTSTLLNQHNSLQYSKDLTLYLQMSLVPTPCQGNFSFL